MGLRPTKGEINALVPLLEQNWETPEVLAEALIKALDQARALRTTYVAVMQFGDKRPVIYAGIGPYAGMASARNAVSTHPAAGEATKVAVVPVMSQEGLAELLREVG